MALTEKDIRKIAKLARIRVDDDKIPTYVDELSNILNCFEVLQEVDTENVPQMTSVADMVLPMRDDVVNDGNDQDRVLNNAPSNEYGCFVVPKVIEEL